MNWIWLRSRLGDTVKVHPSDKGKIAVYERYGWIKFTPKPITAEELVGAMKL